MYGNRAITLVHVSAGRANCESKGAAISDKRHWTYPVDPEEGRLGKLSACASTFGDAGIRASAWIEIDANRTRLCRDNPQQRRPMC